MRATHRPAKGHIQGRLIALMLSIAVLIGITLLVFNSQSKQVVIHPADLSNFIASEQATQISSASIAEEENTHEDEAAIVAEETPEASVEKAASEAEPSKTIVSGRFINAQTGEGIAQIPVSGNSFIKGALATNHSDELGNFKLELFPSTETPTLYFQLPDSWLLGYQSIQGANILDDQIQFPDLKPGDRPTINISLQPAQTIHGRVLWASNSQPVEDVTVSFQFPHTQTRESEIYSNFSTLPKFPTREVTTNAEGNFNFKVYKAPIIIIQARNEIAFAEKTVSIPDTGQVEDIILRIEQFGSISGRVLDPKGDGVTDVNIIAINESISSNSSNQWHSQIVKKPNGEFTFTELTPGTYKLEIDPHFNSPASNKYVTPEPLRVDLPPGLDLTNQDLVFTEGDIIEGTVTDLEDYPLEGADIYARSWRTENSINKNTTTDSQGKFRIEGIPPDAQIEWLAASKTGYERDYRRDITIYDGPQHFKLRPFMGIIILAVDQATNPITHYRYNFFIERWGEQYERHGDSNIVVQSTDGKTYIENIDSGTYRLEVSELDNEGNPTGRVGLKTFELVGELSEETIEVTLSEGITLTGTVIDETDTPVQNARVILDPVLSQSGNNQLPESFENETVTDSSGHFEFQHVAPGQHQLFAQTAERQAPHPTIFEILENTEQKPIIIKIISPAKLFGTIIGENGTPISGLQIELSYYDPSAQKSYQPQITDSEGKYEFNIDLVGWHGISFSYSPQDINISESFRVEASEQKEMSYDFSNVVDLSGVITINGERWDGSTQIQIIDKQGTGFPVNYHRNGSYQTRLRPGTYYLAMERISLLNDPVEITGNTKQQIKHFDINYAEYVDVIIEFPEDQEFQPGMLTFRSRQPDSSGWWEDDGSLVSLPSKRYTNLPPGEYQATFRAQADETITGASDWVSVSSGKENIIILPVTVPQEHTYELTVQLDPGHYEYKFYVEPGVWSLDPLNPVLVQPGGFDNSAFEVPGGAVDNEGVRHEWPRVNDQTGEVTFRFTTESTNDHVYARGIFSQWSLMEKFRMKRVD